ncbi:glycosyltransferase family 2 protein [Thaumasiovibrio sp. DFM-14]|uniref:glycosyltransferase family 2 protein n=1 Tax=Thaumasiovibrio sp. DFM-14 TaxID=3384792 RepID=UPI00399F0CD7
MNQCRVTVVIPTYNCFKTLIAAIETVRAQKMPLEIIVVDDGSTDGSGEWLQQQTDITLLSTARLGVSKARNAAISQAKGELIAFLDADDYWHPDKLRFQLALHDANPQMVLSFTDYHFIVDDQATQRNGFRFWPRFVSALQPQASETGQCFDNFVAHVYCENMVGTSTVIARRDALLAVGGFDASLRSASDWDLWLKLAQCGDVGVVNRPLGQYTFGRTGAISTNHGRRANAMKTILDRHVRSVWRQPVAMLIGYQRWFSAKADAKRAEHAYGRAMLTEGIGFLLRPRWLLAKRISNDTIKWLSA